MYKETLHIISIKSFKYKPFTQVDRKQNGFVNNECSNPDSVKVDVPKGYVLIPFFFYFI
jgi:hypothetical protein